MSGDAGQCVAEIQNVGLGGIQARVARDLFGPGEFVEVSPQDGEPLRYEVRWARKAGGGMELGMRYPESIAGFWHSWAADLLAGTELTNSEVMERRLQIRLNCAINGFVKIKRKQLKGKVLDLGVGGFLFKVDSDLSEGAKGELTIKDPIRIGHAPCRVVRAFPESGSYGFSFTGLKDRHRLAVVRLLDLLVRQS